MNLLESSYTLCIVLLGTSLLGITAGVLGVFAVLRRQSLLGDAISHAALPGIALAFLLTHSKNPIILLTGGALSGGLGTLAVNLITHKTGLKQDAALGIILSVFFGFGLVLMTVIQKMAITNQVVLNKFLFGNASALLPTDFYPLIIVSCVVLGTILLLWKEFSMLTFDQHFTQAIGFKAHLLDVMLTILFIVTITLGLQTVGVILISSLFIAPASAARLWCIQLHTTVMLAALFAAFACCCGAFTSNAVANLPTGPTIVIIMSCLVFISLFSSKKRP
jgi:manganese/zinc/iron transport system permease protein